VCRRTPPGYLSFLRAEQIPYLVTGTEHVDLRSALVKMASSLGVRRVLATGGGRLGGALLRAGVIDELDLELAPTLIGGDTTPSLFDGRPLGSDESPVRLTFADARHESGHLIVRSEVLRETARVASNEEDRRVLEGAGDAKSARDDGSSSGP
jgi:riboflavin biosynthesis pyrimidine reductase